MKDIRLIVKFHEFFMKQHRLFGKFRYGTFPSSGYQFSREIQIWYLESKSIQLSFLLVKFTERKLFIINTYARVSIYGETNFTMMILVMTVIRNSLLMLSNLTKYVGLYKTKNDHVSSHTKTMRNSEAEEKYWTIETKKKQYRMEKTADSDQLSSEILRHKLCNIQRFNIQTTVQRNSSKAVFYAVSCCCLFIILNANKKIYYPVNVMGTKTSKPSLCSWNTNI